jgi:IS30 family transposase
VCREVARHGGRPAYRAHDADQQAWVSALRPKRCLLGVNRKLRDLVASKLILDWSPEQISGWKNQYPNDESLRASHETIYRSLFIQARGVLKKELMGHLRSKRRMRRSRHSSEHGQSRGQIVDAISIRERPAEVEDRAIPGHWEGDLLAGGKNSYIATLVERHSRFAMLIKVPSKETEAVVAALSQHVRKLPATLKRSLTWDRGLEMAKHKEFTVATKVQVYFCDQLLAIGRLDFRHGSAQTADFNDGNIFFLFQSFLSESHERRRSSFETGCLPPADKNCISSQLKRIFC